MSALNISPINEMYSSSQIICRPPTSYPHPSLPPTLQIQTIAILLDRGPPLHQQGGRRLQMWLLSSIEITPIQSSSSAGLTLCIMKNIKSKVNQTLDILKKKKKLLVVIHTIFRKAISSQLGVLDFVQYKLCCGCSLWGSGRHLQALYVTIFHGIKFKVHISK